MAPLRVRIVQATIMAAFMAAVMSGVLTLVNTGFDVGYPGRWLKAFLIAWPIAALAAFFFAPLAQRLTQRWVGGAHRPGHAG